MKLSRKQREKQMKRAIRIKKQEKLKYLRIKIRAK